MFFGATFYQTNAPYENFLGHMLLMRFVKCVYVIPMDCPLRCERPSWFLFVCFTTKQSIITKKKKGVFKCFQIISTFSAGEFWGPLDAFLSSETGGLILVYLKTYCPEEARTNSKRGMKTKSRKTRCSR